MARINVRYLIDVLSNATFVLFDLRDQGPKSKHDFIGAAFLSLSSISGPGDVDAGNCLVCYVQ